MLHLSDIAVLACVSYAAGSCSKDSAPPPKKTGTASVLARAGSRTWQLPPPEIRPEDAQEATPTALEIPFMEVRKYISPLVKFNLASFCLP